MIHTEHLRASDETIESRHDNRGNAIHCYLTGDECILFPTLDDFIQYIYLSNTKATRVYTTLKKWNKICAGDEYDFYKVAQKFNLILAVTVNA